MDLTTLTPDTLMMIGAIAFVAILIAVWYVYRREQAKKPHHPFGVDHTQAIMEMGARTRAEAERRERMERDMRNGTPSHMAR